MGSKKGVTSGGPAPHKSVIRPSFEVDSDDEDNLTPSFPPVAYDVSSMDRHDFAEMQQTIAQARLSEVYAAMTGHYRILVPDPSSPGKQRPLDACPSSPLCPSSHCPWPKRREAILGAWSHLGGGGKAGEKGGESPPPRGLGTLSIEELRLVMEYSRDHPRADLQQVAPLTPVRLEWWDPRDWGKKGVWNFEAYDAASVAMELHMINLGVVDEYKVLEGGLLYLVGEPHLFWSMVTHYRATGTCCPPLPTSHAPLIHYNQTVLARTMDEMLGELRQRTARMSIRGRGSTHHQGSSKNMAAVAFIKHRRHSRFPPEMQSTGRLPITRAALPKWWVAAVEPWDRMIAPAMRDTSQPGHLPCMFYLTPFGCVGQEGGRCVFRHDVGLKTLVETLKTQPWRCAKCGDYAELKCGRCGRARYCNRACQKEDWRQHKLSCPFPS